MKTEACSYRGSMFEAKIFLIGGFLNRGATTTVAIVGIPPTPQIVLV